MKNLSFWEADLILEQRDLVIVGAGLTGLFAALTYIDKFPNHNILIVDRHVQSRVASTRNAGFLCFGSPTELLADAKSMGWDDAMSLAISRYNGLKAMLEMIPKQRIDYNPCGGYEFFDETVITDDELRQLNSGLETIGGEIFFRHPSAIDKMGFSTYKDAIYNPLEAAIHPAKLVKYLTDRCRNAGIDIVEGLSVSSVEQQAVYIHGIDRPIKTRKTLIAANGLARELLSNLDVQPARNLVLYIEPDHPLSWNATCHMHEGYVYFRNIGTNLLIGGGRHVDKETAYTAEFGVNERVKEYLIDLVDRIILPGQMYKVKNQWSGLLGVSLTGKDKRPIVKKINEHTFVAARMSGMGVALSKSVADDVVDLISNNE